MTEQSPALQHTDDDDADHKPTSCAEAKSVRSNTNDGEYTLYPFSTDSDVSLRVYCHDMASEKPKEFLTLPSGPDENYAIFFGDRLQPFARRGTTKFSKLRIQFHTSRIEVIGNDYTFAQTTGPNDVAYGHAGDCYTAAQGCAKGTFKVDLIGTGLELAPEVHWAMGPTYPGYLTINDMFISEDRKPLADVVDGVVTAGPMERKYI
ncbi:A disintegrin and metalloproteinase with thrombospondin motifs 9-like [Branchiostoma floridae]|uniref:A disintegrin and metalloproteinase with thrombospondin motifs 9-like n=1 Tax=Branchiostoma floridae TaxID=7739 RepID=A0A9J7KGM7_BRAFL|nr:A disintegrin and metalloproteinase with thrombospondin motifs 9-like [Branchiostoma floridae]